MKKKVIVSVINDLVTDQRVNKSCQSLSKMGFDVLLVGRKLPQSLPMDDRSYRSLRMRLLFKKGAFFYAEFNLRLFFLLLFRKADLLVANDLDTLLPNYLVSKLKRTGLVYDSHEYFTEVPELTGRKRVQKIWKAIEKSIFPKLKDVITVNDSIATLYEKEYGIRPVVVRNVPVRGSGELKPASRKDLGISESKKILILQGAGINIQRGAEEMVEAMQYIEGAVLLIVGGGDVIEQLKKTVREKSLGEKVIFKARQTYDKLMQFTALADLGLTLDKDTNLNYRYSLPNKLFDYIQAGTPVLASPLPEIKKIISTYRIGDFIPDHDPKNIAAKISEILSSQLLMEEWKKNLSFASFQLNWEKEEKTLQGVYSKYA
ncbi:MAG: glycosyltransferase [Bacteroidales bacterium]|nr:glycosyltransferase [Bacteroidales bacterium]